MQRKIGIRYWFNLNINLFNAKKENGVVIFAGFNDNAVSHFEKVYIPFSMDTIKIEEQPNGYNYGGGYY